MSMLPADAHRRLHEPTPAQSRLQYLSATENQRNQNAERYAWICGHAPWAVYYALEENDSPEQRPDTGTRKLNAFIDAMRTGQ